MTLKRDIYKSTASLASNIKDVLPNNKPCAPKNKSIYNNTTFEVAQTKLNPKPNVKSYG